MSSEIERKTVFQWIGVLAVSICIPLLVYANQEGQKDQQLSQLFDAIKELKQSQDETRRALQKDLDALKQTVNSEAQKNSANSAVLSRLESKMDITAGTVTKHGEQIAVLNAKAWSKEK